MIYKIVMRQKKRIEQTENYQDSRFISVISVNTSSLETIICARALFIRHVERNKSRDVSSSMHSSGFKRLLIVPTRSRSKVSVLWPRTVFLIKTIIRARLVRAFRVDGGKRKQKIIGYGTGKFNYNRLAFTNTSRREI